jgi:two-component system C4-dicarboxylate transport sensor histidine kinase DctB
VASPPASLRKPAGKVDSLAAAHARFARAALLIYLGAIVVGISLLVVALVTDKAHEEDQTRERLLLETDVRAHSLGQHLGLLVEELRRLGLRSEVDLLDQNLAPEKSLLALSHEKSTFFNLGVAILNPKGTVLWTEPRDFLLDGTSFAAEKWFSGVRFSQALRIVPVQPDRSDAVLYVVSPILRGGEFQGALLGGVDLARGEPLSAVPQVAGGDVLTVLATQEGAVVYPPRPPAFAIEPAWKDLFHKSSAEPFTEIALLGGRNTVVAASPVSGTDLILLTVAARKPLFAPARTRLETRISLGLLLAATPLVLLVALLRRSLDLFRVSEQDAVREERLRLLGEAANSIAHEVKNALNGLSMGLDLVVRRDERPEAAQRRERVLNELRNEIHRLADFTTQLMTFSKGIELRRARVDLTDFVPKVTSLHRDAAVELGADIELDLPPGPLMISADPTLLHAVIGNLTGNALDAATGPGGSPDPRVEIHVITRAGQVELRVTDNGPGVSRTMRPRLFEPFQTEKTNGVGIGLALARKIALAHRGDLVLEDPPPPSPPTKTPIPGAPSAPPPHPRGATFLLTLPLEPA